MQRMHVATLAQPRPGVRSPAVLPSRMVDSAAPIAIATGGVQPQEQGRFEYQGCRQMADKA